MQGRGGGGGGHQKVGITHSDTSDAELPPLTCSVSMDALPRLWANSATICCTAALSGAPGTAASLTRT